jgi:DNA-binding transcriptional MerR regulator
MQLSQKRAPEPPTIPNRLYFKIGEVARLCELEPYVLRFWETQFPQLKPNKGGTGQRLYRRREVELVYEIKRLVHGEGYTIAGARQALESASRGPKREPQSRLALTPSPGTKRQDAIAATIGHARAELREIAAMLAAPAPQPPRRRAKLTAMPSATQLTGSLFPG